MAISNKDSQIASASNLVYVILFAVGSFGMMGLGEIVAWPFEAWVFNVFRIGPEHEVLPVLVGLIPMLVATCLVFSGCVWALKRFHWATYSGRLAFGALAVALLMSAATAIDTTDTAQIITWSNSDSSLYYQWATIGYVGLTYVLAAAAVGLRGTFPGLATKRGRKSTRAKVSAH